MYMSVGVLSRTVFEVSECDGYTENSNDIYEFRCFWSITQWGGSNTSYVLKYDSSVCLTA